LIGLNAACEGSTLAEGGHQGLYSQVEQKGLASVAGPASRASHPKVVCLAPKFAKGGTKPWPDVFP